VVDTIGVGGVPGESIRGATCRESMSNAGLGKVLNVEPRDVYLIRHM